MINNEQKPKDFSVQFCLNKYKFCLKYKIDYFTFL